MPVSALVITYIGLIFMLQILLQFRVITSKQYNGWAAVLTAGGGAFSAVNGWTFYVYLHAGIAAWCAWMWWNSGGGDDTKRRLKRWASRFHGVRRTAPAGAS
jgi:hypothetical protein